MKQNAEMRFSSGIELTDAEKAAELKLNELRDEIITPIHAKGKKPRMNPTIHNFFKMVELVKDSKLYQALHWMPKGAHHHLHLTAGCHVDFLIELTKDDIVWFSERANQFKVCPGDRTPEESGYVRCNDLREFYKNPEDFNNYLRENILITEKEAGSQESEAIWELFQYKFLMTNDLYNYAPFFERVVNHIFEYCVAEQIFICELKHIFGFVFDDNHDAIEASKELEIIDRCIKKMQQKEPLFECRLVVCGLKALGYPHIQKEIDDMHEALHDEKYKDLIAAYDMVNEEDTTPPISDFVTLIDEAVRKEDGNFPLMFHAGESDESHNTNMYDALLLGCKRIGHGFNIALHPKLVEFAIKEKICLEICPISNFVLAYVLDMRVHPARFLINQGLQISINSDDPGFYGYKGVTLDFVYVFLAWQLTLADLKQLALNGIEFSSLSPEKKELHFEKFHKDWEGFIRHMRTDY